VRAVPKPPAAAGPTDRTPRGGTNFEAVHAPHAEQTRLRCQAHDQVLVLHDTTVLKFNGDREGLGRIHDAGAARGFRLHASLAVTPDRAPLGVLGGETWARTTRLDAT
jgi:hypothetical protein